MQNPNNMVYILSDPENLGYIKNILIKLFKIYIKRIFNYLNKIRKKILNILNYALY